MTVDLEPSDEPIEPPAQDGAAVDDSGYNLEASVCIPAADDFGREHLLRYCARPPLSLSRLVELPHGKLGYRIKKLRNRRNKLRVMTPIPWRLRSALFVAPRRRPQATRSRNEESARAFPEVCATAAVAPARRDALRPRSSDGTHRKDGIAHAQRPRRRPLGTPEFWAPPRHLPACRLGAPHAPHLRRRRPRMPQVHRQAPHPRHRRRPHDRHANPRRAPHPSRRTTAPSPRPHNPRARSRARRVLIPSASASARLKCAQLSSRFHRDCTPALSSHNAVIGKLFQRAKLIARPTLSRSVEFEIWFAGHARSVGRARVWWAFPPLRQRPTGVVRAHRSGAFKRAHRRTLSRPMMQRLLYHPLRSRGAFERGN